ncbi:PilW family protein [Aurantivibrio plasticivorans]
MKSFLKYNKGFSLIELLVALAISAIILAGVVQIFLGSKQAENLTMSLARLQESGRFVTDTLSKEFRLAGFQGCIDPNQDFIDATSILANGFSLTDISNQVIEGGETPTAGGDVSLFSGGVVITDAIGGTDVVSLTYASPSYEELDSDMTTPSSDIVITDNSTGFAQNDILLITNCSGGGSFIFKATSVGSGTPPITITHTTTSNSSDAFGTTVFFEDDRVQRIANNTYYIRLNPRGIRSLYRRSFNGTVEELIEGVENLQIQYGHYDDKGTANSSDDSLRWVTAADINGSASLEWRNVVSMKAAVLISDDIDVLAENGPATYAMLDANVAPVSADKKLRRVFSTSAKVRNRDGKRIAQ